jgi:hypothetical protein
VRQATPGFGGGRGVRFRLLSIILPLVGSIGSVVAWTHWRPPLRVPGLASQAQLTGALGPLGNGLAGAHGLSTGHGAIGLAASIACVAGLVGLLLPGRLRLVAAGVVALSSLAIAANGLTAFVSANHLHQQWTTLTHGIGTGSSSPLKGVSSAIIKGALAPSAGAAAAGAIGFAGGLRAARTAVRSFRQAVSLGSLGLPGMAP